MRAGRSGESAGRRSGWDFRDALEDQTVSRIQAEELRGRTSYMQCESAVALRLGKPRGSCLRDWSLLVTSADAADDTTVQHKGE